ncbi:hypothetical protein BDN72DRAFT_348751 [Pluteus cervinus]|uniref:Uncharacterized protein n=1 Tax=Pluteus cervinus TaxID=181527 RepID=A0ACD3ADA7_9AGAR|nr:hypothetical protein BDN72DRAFT_348751 [Pluteus cervinus]
MPVHHFVQRWKERERVQPVFFNILKSSLWFQSILSGLFDPLVTFQGITHHIISKYSSSGLLSHSFALVNLLLCIMTWYKINIGSDLIFFTFFFHVAIHLFLQRFFHLNL